MSLYLLKPFVTYLTLGIIGLSSPILVSILFLAKTVNLNLNLNLNLKPKLGETFINVYININLLDIRLGNLNDALFQHISQTDHNFDFYTSTMLARIHSKRLRQIFEAGAILLLPSVNTRPVFFNRFLS